MRPLAIAKPIQVATAVTPSQPTSGTGRGRLGRATIRWNQSTMLRKASAMALVTCITGLFSRPAMIPLRNSVSESCRSVLSRPGRSRVC